MNANDDAIDDLFEMIENWEELTGRPFYTDQHLVAEPKSSPGSEPDTRLTLDRRREPYSSPIRDEDLVERAKAIMKERQLQYRDMPTDLDCDEYVRILLLLLVEELSETDSRVTSIGYGIGRPQTTVLRYLLALEDHSLIYRATLPSDGRVTLIKLTDEGRELAKALVCRAIETSKAYAKR